MPTLGDHWDSAGTDWAPEGEHTMEIMSHSQFKANTGTRGVQFELAGADGGAKVAFYLSDKALWKLAKFAKAAGITRPEADAYDPYQEDSHDVLVGKVVNVTIGYETSAKDGKDYKTVKSFRAASATRSEAPRPMVPQVDTPAKPEDDNDPIPF